MTVMMTLGIIVVAMQGLHVLAERQNCKKLEKHGIA